MYEQNEVPVFRRILWIILWFIVAIAVLWVLVWLIFFRHSTPKVSVTEKTHNSQNQPVSTPAPKDTASSSTSPATTSPNTTPSSSTKPPSTSTSASTATPSELVNTGAGNMLVPFMVASVTGSALYYVRLRKKLQA